MPGDKRKKAVGIKYDPSKYSAPRVKAKGAGYLADRILNLARKHGVPIRQDNELVEDDSIIKVVSSQTSMTEGGEDKIMSDKVVHAMLDEAKLVCIS